MGNFLLGTNNLQGKVIVKLCINNEISGVYFGTILQVGVPNRHTVPNKYLNAQGADWTFPKRTG